MQVDIFNHSFRMAAGIVASGVAAGVAAVPWSQVGRG